MDLLIGLVERGRGDSLKIDQTKKDDEVGVGVVGNEKKKQEGVVRWSQIGKGGDGGGY